MPIQPYISKILTVLIVAMVIIGGGLLWWLYALTPQTEGPAGQTVQNGVYYSGGGNNQTTVTSPSTGVQLQTQIQAFPDIKAAYQTLFPQILGTEVQFVPTTASSTGDIKIIYALYSDDVAAEQKAYPSVGDFAVDIALVDITDDGVPEAIVFENLPSFCGSGGCPLDVYKKVNSKWTNIYSIIAGSEVGLSNTLINGYLDLYMTVGGSDTVDRYSWDGTTYQFKEVMAVWDGTSFHLPQ
ncbi:hypothetical protein A3D68_01305 [Candidatus Adlerbacteria bacterium RIFCSPHIGHO2_02_FULL_52_17]|uniref:Uncharacterized protein n=1 Tax=Candidatus Adlerbacteria bacterium RIFCSPHIGHO2_02_FULL_52_17 TaxID=1797240 RepID=A0A1F4XMV3_9BACT|nr:MAG: hypothetical protein A3D68_01305 [Candidatus Adlerbacteria bacterium RIFCSPHIGHO2_02_FULL_52_17]